jgi:hypothetical protein
MPNTMSGYQADLGYWDGKGLWGDLYDESRRNKKLAEANQTELSKVLKLEDWNEYRSPSMGIVTFVESDSNCPAKFPSVSRYRSDAKTGRPRDVDLFAQQDVPSNRSRPGEQ